MKKGVAHCFLLIFDLAAFLAIWWLFHETQLIETALSTDTPKIEYNNRMYFMLAGLIVPAVHLLSLLEAFRPEAISSSANKCIVGVLIVLLISAWGLSFSLNNRIEKSGYMHCRKLDSRMSFSTYLVYVNDPVLCESLYKVKMMKKLHRD